MSETIETSAFTSGGFESMPSLYVDSKLVSKFSDEFYTDDMLSLKADEYADFLSQPNLMPRAKAAAEKVEVYLMFEMCYRAGWYEKERHHGR